MDLAANITLLPFKPENQPYILAIKLPHLDSGEAGSDQEQDNGSQAAVRKETTGGASTPAFSIADFNSGDWAHFRAFSTELHVNKRVNWLGSLASRKTWSESSPKELRKPATESYTAFHAAKSFT
jgi:hypothetical protein